MARGTGGRFLKPEEEEEKEGANVGSNMNMCLSVPRCSPPYSILASHHLDQGVALVLSLESSAKYLTLSISLTNRLQFLCCAAVAKVTAGSGFQEAHVEEVVAIV